MEGLSSGGNMTHWRESLMEAARPIALLTSKTTTKIATWNIRTTYEVGKAVQMAAQMNNYKISLLDLCDTRWTQTGQVRLSTGETLCTQATRKRKPPSPPSPPPPPPPHTEGAASFLTKKAQCVLISWEVVSSRLTTAMFRTQMISIKIEVVQCYAPTNDAEKRKEDF